MYVELDGRDIMAFPFSSLQVGVKNGNGMYVELDGRDIKAKGFELDRRGLGWVRTDLG